MSNLLAIFTEADGDAELLHEITVRSPDRVTVLLSDESSDLLDADSPAADAVRERMARLLSAVEHRTGATVVGCTGDRRRCSGEAFDAELGAGLALAV